MSRLHSVTALTVALFATTLSTGCASSHDARILQLEQRLTQLESGPTADRDREILDRLPVVEARLTELDERTTTLNATFDRLGAIAEELAGASKQAREFVQRVEKIETFEQLGKYGTFLVEERDRLLDLLASIEAEYRQVNRQVPGLLKAREIQIVDETGQVLASLGEDAFGAGHFQLRSGGGKDLVTIGSSDRATGGRIQVHRNAGAAALDLWVDVSGAGNLQTTHRDAGVLVELTHDEVDGQLEVHSAAGPAVALGVVDGTKGTIETWDERGQTLVTVGSMASGGGALTVYDHNQFPVVLLRVVDAVLGKVDVLGPNGRARELRPR